MACIPHSYMDSFAFGSIKTLSQQAQIAQQLGSPVLIAVCRILSLRIAREHGKILIFCKSCTVAQAEVMDLVQKILKEDLWDSCHAGSLNTSAARSLRPLTTRLLAMKLQRKEGGQPTASWCGAGPGFRSIWSSQTHKASRGHRACS